MTSWHRNFLLRFEYLEDALSQLGFAPHVSAWKIATLIHRVAGEQDGVLRRSAREIAADKDVKCGYQTARKTISKLIELGIVEIVKEVRPPCRGGRPIRWLAINWQSVNRINSGAAEQPVMQEVKQPVMQPVKQPVSQEVKQPVIQNSLLSSHIPTPPPPLSDSEKAAAEVLGSVLSDSELVNQLARRHPETVIDVVAEFNLNRSKFKSPGAIAYRLSNGSWPVDDQITTIDQHRRQQQKRSLQRQKQAAERQRQQAESEDAKRLEGQYGQILDAMPDHEKTYLARNALGDHFEQWKRWPGLFRSELLEALDRNNVEVYA